MKNIREITDLGEVSIIIKNYIIKNKLSEEYIINFNCPLDILDSLINDSNVLVRKIGVSNRNCSVQSLERIIKFDSNSTIKKTAIQNPNCSKELLERLLMDSDFFIRDAAKKRLDNFEIKNTPEFKKSKDEIELDSMIQYYNELKEIQHQKEKLNKPKIMADPNEIAAARRMAVSNVGRLDVDNNNIETISSEMPQVTVSGVIVDSNNPAPVLPKHDVMVEYDEESEEDRLFEAEIERELASEEEKKSPSKLLLTINKLKRSNKLFVRKFYHSIKVEKDTFLTLVGDHYEIKSEFLSVLNFLNLENIDTRNLKISGIDISESNLKINPQEIYNKDLSNATLDDKNLVSYNFDGVNMEGTNVGIKKYD